MVSSRVPTNHGLIALWLVSPVGLLSHSVTVAQSHRVTESQSHRITEARRQRGTEMLRPLFRMLLSILGHRLRILL